jgi:hypothetical protein
MKQYDRRTVVVLILVCLVLAACGQSPSATTEEENHPVKVEHLEGKDPTRETLTEDAARRLDIQTAAIRDTQVNGVQRTVIPYAAILYDTQGATWAYASPEALTFVRTPIVVDRIDGDTAILSDGPPAGTLVVTVGATELYGAEFEFQEE